MEKQKKLNLRNMRNEENFTENENSNEFLFNI